jgi:peptidoglycan hydrolase CwlO-like protein
MDKKDFTTTDVMMLVEDIRSEFRIVAEAVTDLTKQQGQLREDVDGMGIEIKGIRMQIKGMTEMIAQNTVDMTEIKNDIIVIKSDITDIKQELKHKVNRDEFAALEEKIASR